MTDDQENKLIQWREWIASPDFILPMFRRRATVAAIERSAREVPPNIQGQPLQAACAQRLPLTLAAVAVGLVAALWLKPKASP